MDKFIRASPDRLPSVSVAVIVAVGVNTDGLRDVLGMDIGPSEAETFWTEFLRSLRSRGLQGVKLVITDAHTGLKVAIARVCRYPGGTECSTIFVTVA